VAAYWTSGTNSQYGISALIAAAPVDRKNSIVGRSVWHSEVGHNRFGSNRAFIAGARSGSFSEQDFRGNQVSDELATDIAVPGLKDEAFQDHGSTPAQKTGCPGFRGSAIYPFHPADPVWVHFAHIDEDEPSAWHEHAMELCESQSYVRQAQQVQDVCAVHYVKRRIAKRQAACVRSEQICV
jgi:hypothetical protein